MSKLVDEEMSWWRRIRILSIVILAAVGLTTVVLCVGCHGRCAVSRPDGFVGSTSMTVEELERRMAEAYPPGMAVWEAE